MLLAELGKKTNNWLEIGPNASSSSVSSKTFIIKIGTTIHSALREGSFKGTQKSNCGMTEVTTEEEEVG